VFEFITDELGAQGTLCGGGRYDGLFEILGGKPTPAVGWGMGIERVLELVKAQGLGGQQVAPDAFAIVPDDASLAVVMKTLQALRMAGLKVQMNSSHSGEGMGSIKAQFKRADASGAKYALIFGADELALGQVAVKSLRTVEAFSVQQSRYPLDDAATWAARLLA
jgi:histidyl-tRNA synthetase